jgi:hypothetical protein
VDPFGDHRTLIRRLERPQHLEVALDDLCTMSISLNNQHNHIERMHHKAGFGHLIEARNVDLAQIASDSHSGDHRPQIVAVKAQNGSGASPNPAHRLLLSRDRAQLAIGLLALSSSPIAK